MLSFRIVHVCAPNTYGRLHMEILATFEDKINLYDSCMCTVYICTRCFHSESFMYAHPSHTWGYTWRYWQILETRSIVIIYVCVLDVFIRIVHVCARKTYRRLHIEILAVFWRQDQSLWLMYVYWMFSFRIFHVCAPRHTGGYTWTN